MKQSLADRAPKADLLRVEKLISVELIHWVKQFEYTKHRLTLEKLLLGSLLYDFVNPNCCFLARWAFKTVPYL